MHLAQVDITHGRLLGVPRNVMLDQQPILENGNLIQTVALAHDHFSLHVLSTRQEFCFRNRGPFATFLTPRLTANPFRFQPRGTVQCLDSLAFPAIGTSPTPPPARRAVFVL